MRTIPIALQSHYEAATITTALLWKITRTDGVVAAFTDHDEAITYDSVTYARSSAFDASAAVTKAEMTVDDLEVVGLLDTSGITAQDIERGLWDAASVQILRVNWKDLSAGADPVFHGEIGNIERRAGGFVCELRDLFQYLRRQIGRNVSPLCDAVVGDARCGVDMAPFTFTTTVTAVGSDPRRMFTCSSLTQPAGYFADGKAEFTSGANDGRTMDVKSSVSGAITLQLQMPYPVQVGDTLTISAGCNKVHQLTYDDAGEVTGVEGDCFNKFDNVVNFRGSPFVPGRDKTLIVGGQ